MLPPKVTKPHIYHRKKQINKPPKLKPKQNSIKQANKKPKSTKKTPKNPKNKKPNSNLK